MDMLVDYHNMHSLTATIKALTIPARSLMRSNSLNEYNADIGRGLAEDFALFAIRRGLKVTEVNKHKDSTE